MSSPMLECDITVCRGLSAACVRFSRNVVQLDNRSRTSDLAASQWSDWISAAPRASVVTFPSHGVERYYASVLFTVDRF